VETIPLMIIKKDNNREPYDRSKIESGIMRACHKRPVSTADINMAVDNIEAQIFALEDKEVKSNVIGELVMKQLKDMDEVAYVRFASVYREFRDVSTFLEELEKLYRKQG
jgi:transcriptional repressor NrdR